MLINILDLDFFDENAKECRELCGESELFNTIIGHCTTLDKIEKSIYEINNSTN